MHAVKLSIPSVFGSGLAPIDGTTFEAKPLRQNPFSHGYRVIKTTKTNTQDLTRLWPKGLANCKQQKVIALSSAEAELYAMVAASAKALAISAYARDLGLYLLIEM